MTIRCLTPLPRGFHGDRHLLRLVGELAAGARVFVETGSNVGSTLGDVARRYPHLDCHSCEPDADAHAAAQRHACVRPGVALHCETSQEFMARLERDHAELFDQPLLAWLDAHDYGFEWPLREEVAFFTSRFASGCLLIDDFEVPHDPSFGWDEYQGQRCAFDYVEDAIHPGAAYRLYYPAYSEHTSPWHPLRGWGLLQFGPSLEALPRLEEALADLCRPAASRPAVTVAAASAAASNGTSAAGPVATTAPAATAPEPDRRPFQSEPGHDLEETIERLRAQVVDHPEDAEAWNDLGVCLVSAGRERDGLTALAHALRNEPDHGDAGPNYAAVARANHAAVTDDPRPLPISTGTWGYMARRDPYRDLAALLDVERPTIVDGGANRGDTVARLREYFPAAVIHAFEPIPELAAKVRARFPDDGSVIVHCAALSSRDGTLSFGVRHSDATSSVLEPSPLGRRYQGASVDEAARIEALSMTLDRTFQDPVDVLKLDLQGHEVEALRGFERGIAGVRLVLTEVEFAPLYEGQPLFADVDAWMRAAGFRLFNLYDVWTHPDGQVTAGDALYVNERYFA